MKLTKHIALFVLGSLTTFATDTPKNIVESVQFLDGKNGYALIGNDNCILRTANGGKTWVVQPRPRGPAKMFFVTPQAGRILIMAQDSVQLFATKDSGRTWTSRSVINGNFLPQDLAFIDHQIGVLLLNDREKHRTRIFRTNNGGAHFEEVRFPDDTLSLNRILLDHAGRLWAAGNGFLLGSKDNGLTWKNYLPAQVQPNVPELNDVLEHDEFLYLAGQRAIYRFNPETNDFVEISKLPATMRWATSLADIAGQVCAVGASSQMFCLLNNGSRALHALPSSKPTQTRSSLFRQVLSEGSTNTWVVEEGGALSLSTNAGESWRRQDLPTCKSK